MQARAAPHFFVGGAEGKREANARVRVHRREERTARDTLWLEARGQQYVGDERRDRRLEIVTAHRPSALRGTGTRGGVRLGGGHHLPSVSRTTASVWDSVARGIIKRVGPSWVGVVPRAGGVQRRRFAAPAVCSAGGLQRWRL